MIEISLLFVAVLVVYNSNMWKKGEWENLGKTIWFKNKKVS
jgi:hypothetical protein